jgi:hypothetical protein
MKQQEICRCGGSGVVPVADYPGVESGSWCLCEIGQAKFQRVARLVTLQRVMTA